MAASSYFTFSVVIILISFVILLFLRRLYKSTISESSERLFFDDWDGFEDQYSNNPEKASNYLIKKTNDILERFSFMRATLFVLFLLFLFLVIIPIDWVTLYFQEALNTSFSLFGIYCGYLVWRFSKSIRQLKTVKRDILSTHHREFV